MKRMLINATQPEERRLAIVDGQKLLDFETEIEGREQRKGNIYKAVITRVEPARSLLRRLRRRPPRLPAVQGDLANYFREGVDAANARIQDAVKEGDSLLVQVEKEERGNKGAALTTFVSLAGRYLVLMPNNPRGGGVSRRIEGEDREELKENLDQLEYPKGMSLIARTAGIGRSARRAAVGPELHAQAVGRHRRRLQGGQGRLPDLPGEQRSSSAPSATTSPRTSARS
jgi:ribonuclease E